MPIVVMTIVGLAVCALAAAVGELEHRSGLAIGFAGAILLLAASGAAQER